MGLEPIIPPRRLPTPKEAIFTMTEYKKLLSQVESLVDKMEAQAERIDTLEEELYELKTGFEEAEQAVENEVINKDEEAYLEQVRKFTEYVNALEEIKDNTEL